MGTIKKHRENLIVLLKFLQNFKYLEPKFVEIMGELHTIFWDSSVDVFDLKV